MLVPSASRKQQLAGLVTRYQIALTEGVDPAMSEYLDGRGFTPETIARFRLGVVPEGDRDYPERAGWLVIPYITSHGIVDIRFRRPEGSEDPRKYLGLPGATTRLFNPVALLSGSDSIVVVEGELDAVMATQCGLEAVAIPGANNFKSWFKLALQDVPNIIVPQDGEGNKAAGEGLSKKIAEALEQARIVSLGEYDVNSYVLEFGKDALIEKLFPTPQEEGEDSDGYDGYEESEYAPADEEYWEAGSGDGGDPEALPW